MKKRNYLIFLFLFINLCVQAQQSWLWAKDASSGSLEAGNDVAVDSAGNAYVGGNFRDDLSATYGSGFATRYGGQDGFVAKYSSAGSLIWAFKIGSGGTDDVTGIATDPAGNFYITGSFQNTAQFKGVSTSINISLTSAGGTDAFLAKYNSGGELQWVKQGSNNNNAHAYKIALNSSKIFISGYFDGNANFSFAGSNSITSVGGFDAFFSVHDLSGNCLMIKKVGGNSHDYAHDITADDNNLYVIGTYFSTSLNFYRDNTIIDSTQTNLSSGESDVFYSAYSISTGNLLWEERIGSASGSFDDEGLGIAQRGNYIYLTGGTGPSTIFPGVGTISGTIGESIFLSQALKSNGKNIWAKIESDGGSSTAGHAYDIKAQNDKIWICGEFYSTTNFSGTSITSGGADDIFVASYKTDGTLRYVKKGGESGADKAYGLAIHGGGSVYISGIVGGSAVFDAITFNASNGQNIGVAKLGCNNGSATISGTTAISSGQSTNLTFNFSGTPPFDYIYSDGTSNYSGSSSSSSVTVSVSPAATTTYSLVALTSGSYCDALQSNLTGNAVITVSQVINNNVIAANQTICPGQMPSSLTGTFPSGGSGFYTYVWQQSTDSVSWVTATGINGLQNYSPGFLSNNTYYRRVVSSDSITSISNVVTISMSVISNNSIASSQSLCVGQIPNELIGSLPSGGTGAFTYSWEQSLDNSLWLPAPGTNTAQNYSPPALSVITYYRRIVSSGSCASNTSNVVVITIPEAITNNIISSAQNVCSGQAAAVLNGTIPTGGNTSYVYLWEQSTDSLVWSNAAGINNLINYDPGTLAVATHFRRMVSSGPCAPSFSNTVKINVLPLIANNIVSANQMICSGQVPSSLNGTLPIGGNNSYSYLWEQSSDSITWISAIGSNNLQNYTSGSLTSTAYFRRQINSDACSSVSNLVKITVVPVISNNTITSAQTICNGQAPALLNGSIPAGGNNSFIYLWEQSSDNISWANATGVNNSQNYSPSYLTNTTYFRRSVSSAMCSSDTSSAITITVFPIITNNTISIDQTICSGQVPTLLNGSAPSGGNGSFIYLWEQSADSISWINANGVNNGQNYSPSSLSNTTYYRRTVSSAMCSSSISSTVKITVLPIITNNVISAGQTICFGQTPSGLNGSLPSGGNNSFTYLWERSSDSISWVDASGVNNGQSYSPPSLTSTTYFRRTVNSAMCFSNLSNVIAITVLPVIINNIISVNQTVCSGQTPSVLYGSSPAGGNNAFTYLWEQSTDSISWTNALGINASQNYSPFPLTATTYYRRTVSSAMCSSDTSSVITIIVLPVITNNSISANQTVCSGQTPGTLNGSLPSGGNNLYTYQWFQSNDSIIWISANGINTNQNYSPSSLANTTYYRRVVSSAMCASGMSNVIKIAVLPVISNNVISSSQTLCSGQTPSGLNGSIPSGGNNSFVYLWEQSIDNISWINATGINNTQNYSPSSLSLTSYYRRTVSSAMCSSDTSSAVTVTVLPVIADNTISADQTICSGQAPIVLNGSIPSGGNNFYSYSWEQSVDSTNWTNASGINSNQNYSPSSLTSTVYYRRIITSSTCSPNTSNAITITVLPSISNNTVNANEMICAGQTPAGFTGSIPSGGNNSFVYLWEQSNDNLSWTNANGINNIQDYNSSSLTLTTYFRRTVSSAICSSDISNTIIITVLPVITNNIVTASQTICSGQIPASLNGSSPAGGNNTYTYLWQESTDNTSWLSAAGTNNSQSYNPSTLNDTTYYRRIANSAMCLSDTSSIVIISVLPSLSNNTIVGDQTICYGQDPLVINGSVPAGGNSSYVYLWEQNTDSIAWTSASGINNLQNYSSYGLTSTMYFRRKISSLACAGISNTVAITVLSPVSNNSISSDQTICYGQTPSALNGSTPNGGDNSYSYLWEQSNDNVLWSAANGINNTASYLPSSLTNTIYYRRTINSAMCSSDTSNQISITVLPLISNNAINASQIICSGQIPLQLNGSLPNGGDNSYLYLWQSSADSMSWFTAPGINNLQNYTASALSSTTYFRRIAASAMCSADTSNLITVTALPVISNNIISGNQTICFGQNPTACSGSIPLGGDNVYSYLWEQSLDNNSWSAASGVNNTQDYIPSGISSTMYYRRIVNSGPCSSDTSSSIAIIVLPLITNNSISSDQTICFGQAPSLLTGSSPNGGDNSYTYLWEQSNDSVSWVPAAGINNVQDYSASSLNDTIYYRRTVSSGVCSSSISAAVVITVLPSITNNNITGDQTICSGQSPLGFTGSIPSGGNSSYNYLWEESPDNSSWSSASGINNLSDYTSSALSATMYYRRIITSGSCSSISNFIVITVLPQISGNSISSAQVICDGQTPAVITGAIPNGGDNTYTYLWQESNNNIVWMPAAGTNNIQDYNPTALSATTYYRRAVSSNTCSDTSSSIIVTVNDLPSIILSGNDSICEGDNFNIDLNLTGASPWSLTYSDGTNNFTLNNINSSNYSFTVQPGQSFVYTPVSLIDNNGCAAISMSGSASVMVNLRPTPNAGMDDSICGLTYNLNAIPSIGTGSWSGSAANFSSVNSGNSAVTLPVQGSYILTWTENNYGCTASDDVKINFYEPVTADAGADQHVYFTHSAVLDALPSQGIGTWSLVRGTGNIVSAAWMNSTITDLSEGDNIFKWTVRNGVCPVTEDETKVTVHELMIPNSFSPNGDNINDMYVIRDLEHAYSKSIHVFNTWGMEVFSSEDYENNWDGKGKEGVGLVADTYYYILKVNEENYSGFIVLKRQ